MTLTQHFVTVSVDLDSVCWDGLAGHGASGGSLADAVESCIDGFLGSGFSSGSSRAGGWRGGARAEHADLPQRYPHAQQGDDDA